MIAAIPATALAVSFPTPAIINTCAVPGLSCLGGDMTTYINITVLRAARIAYGGVLFGAMIYYGLKLLFTSTSSDNAFSEAKQAYEYAILGTIFFLCAELVASSFTTQGLVNTTGVISTFQTIIYLFKSALSVALLANIAVEGFRMIAAVEEQEITKARQRFIQGIVGAAIVILGGAIVQSVYQSDTSSGVLQIRGLANFLITVFGFLAVLAVIIGGIMLVLSVDESLKDRARKIITTSLIAVLIVVAASVFVNFFIFP